MEFLLDRLLKEVTFKMSRSGGKGGQNVNKVSSKVELNLDIKSSSIFTDNQKELLFIKLVNRINTDGVLQVITEEERSQFRNKSRCIDKLIIILTNALHQAKPRKPTKPKRSSIEARLRSKLLLAKKKIIRGKNFED